MKFILTKYCKPGSVLYDDAKAKDGSIAIRAGTILGTYHLEILKMLEIRGISICTYEEEFTHKNNPNQDFLNNEAKITSFAHRFVDEVLDNQKIRSLFDYTSPHVKGHSYNVAIYAAMLLGHSGCNMLGSGKDIIAGALLHDIGKDKISDDILYAPRKLTEEEFDIVKLHTLLGYSILVQEGFNKYVTDIALSHHETFNGSGYPNGLCSTEIPWYVDLIHICDIYDAVCAKRVYKEAALRTEARKIIEEQKDKFKPDVFDLFMTKMPEYFVNDLLTAYNRIYEVVGYDSDNTPVLRELVSQQDILLSEINSEIKPYTKLESE